MTDTRPEVSPQGLYTGREVARRLQVDRHIITRWKRSLKLVPRTKDGRYLGKDVVAVWMNR